MSRLLMFEARCLILHQIEVVLCVREVPDPDRGSPAASAAAFKERWIQTFPGSDATDGEAFFKRSAPCCYTKHVINMRAVTGNAAAAETSFSIRCFSGAVLACLG